MQQPSPCRFVAAAGQNPPRFSTHPRHGCRARTPPTPPIPKSPPTSPSPQPEPRAAGMSAGRLHHAVRRRARKTGGSQRDPCTRLAAHVCHSAGTPIDPSHMNPPVPHSKNLAATSRARRTAAGLRRQRDHNKTESDSKKEKERKECRPDPALDPHASTRPGRHARTTKKDGGGRRGSGGLRSACPQTAR